MNTLHKSAKPICLMMAALTIALAHGSFVRGQEKSEPQKPAQVDDVVRVSTALVQTAVMVFDKQGTFVDGLKPDQFELRVDGKPVVISFLEVVTTGSAEEKQQIAAAGKGQATAVSGGTIPHATTAVAGRSLFLFVDDLHLGSESLLRTRKLLLKTIDEMTATDRALVTAASGQLGAQQLTSDKAALKATVERIAFRPGMRQLLETPPMSEYAASSINRGDPSLMQYYVEQIWKEDPRTPREVAEARVMTRVRGIIDVSSQIAANTLSPLENLMREASKVPGLKVLFFISDGFLVENERSPAYPRMVRATQEAARAGMVVYSFDARGLFTTGPDASVGAFDTRLNRSAFSADTANQDIMFTLAANTGGRALVNSNDLNAGARMALDETSKYYLVAWRPPLEETSGAPFKKIEFRITGRPELKIRTRRGAAAAVSEALVTAPTAGHLSVPLAPSAPSPNAELMTALNTVVPQQGLPTALVLIYRNVAASSFALTASMQIPSKALSFAELNGKQVATIDVAGIVIDQHDKQLASFNKRVNIAADSNALDPIRKLVFYSYQTSLAPGRYQIRMGVRDSKSGAIGSAVQSVEIPDLSSGKLALSSLMLLEQAHADDEEETAEKPEVQRGVTQRFAPDSRLRFLTCVYNAVPVAANDNEPDLDVKVEILSGDHPVSGPAFREMLAEKATDANRFPFAGEIQMAGLQTGDYVLRVTIVDRSTKASATQLANFTVD